MRKLSKQWGAVVILAMAVFLLMATTQAGAQPITEKGRNVFWHTKVEVLEIGDVEGHFIGVYESTGLQTLDTGEVAVFEQKGTFNYIKGGGPHDSYVTATYEDGSTTMNRSQGTSRPDPKGKGSVWEGKYTYIKGTGRFAGIKGGGTYTGRRLTPIGAAAQSYSDWTGTYTLP